MIDKAAQIGYIHGAGRGLVVKGHMAIPAFHHRGILLIGQEINHRTIRKDPMRFDAEGVLLLGYNPFGCHIEAELGELNLL